MIIIKYHTFHPPSQQVLVNKVAESSVEEREQEINKVADMADIYLKSGKDTLILTSRQLLVGKSESSSIDIIYSFPPKIGYRSVFYDFYHIRLSVSYEI